MKSIDSSLVDGHGQWVTTDGGCDCPILSDQQVFLEESFICGKYQFFIGWWSWSVSDFWWRLRLSNTFRSTSISMWKFYLWKILIHHRLMVRVSDWLLMEAVIVRYFYPLNPPFTASYTTLQNCGANQYVYHNAISKCQPITMQYPPIQFHPKHYHTPAANRQVNT